MVYRSASYMLDLAFITLSSKSLKVFLLKALYVIEDCPLCCTIGIPCPVLLDFSLRQPLLRIKNTLSMNVLSMKS